MMILRHTLAFTAFAAALMISSCSRTEMPVVDEGASARAAAVETAVTERQSLAGSLASFTPATAEWTMGETRSAITGYFDGDDLRVIEEEMTMGEFGDASAKYFYLPGGKLFAYSEQKNARSGTKSGVVKTEKVSLSLLFSESGALLEGKRSVDGEEAPLVGVEEQGVRMHARELEAALAESRAGAAPRNGTK